MEFCGAWSVVGEDDLGATVVHPLSCRAWSCPRCARRLKRRLLHKLDGTPAHALMTLTCNPRAYSDRNAAFSALSRHVNTLFKRIRRLPQCSDVQYFLVWERTKAGWPHAHLLLRGPFISQRWLSDQWRDLAGSPIVDIRFVRTAHQVVSYIAKDLAKDPQAPPGMKRYRSSQHFFGPLLAGPPSDRPRVVRWTVVHDAPEAVARQLSFAGLVIAAHPDGSFTAWPAGHEFAPLYDALTPHLFYS